MLCPVGVFIELTDFPGRVEFDFAN